MNKTNNGFKPPVDDLVVSVLLSAEVCGFPISEAAADMMVQDLEAYPKDAVLSSLAKCRKSVKGRLTLAEILSRIDDGRPGVEEAWSMLAWDEEATMVTTSEAMEAMGQARSLYLNGDKIAARMAFKETYTRLVTEAREARRPVEWRVSEGWDKAGRVGVIAEAVQKGRISANAARKYLPSVEITDNGRLIEAKPVPMPDYVKALIAGKSAK